jgi:tetratricopeptide (TPR) repeat protein
MVSAVICPSCRAQNRPNWEYCPRCGEALEGAATQVTSRQQTLTGIRAPEEAPRDASSFYLLLMGVIAFGTVALACRDIASQPPPPPATPGVFTFGGPVSPPPPLTVASPSANPDVDAARRLIGQGNLAGAIPLLEKAASENPGNAEYQHLLGQALWNTGNREAALQSYAQAARLEPGTYRVGYAQALETVGRKEEATAELEAVLAAQPGTAIAEEGLSRLYFNRGDYQKAVPLLEGLASRTRDPVVLQQLAYAAEKAGDRERAITTYRDILAAEPRADATRGLLAESLLAAGRQQDAIAVLQEGLQRSPDAPLLQRGLGSVLERSGRPAEAVAAYREYARLAPNAPDAAEISARAARLEALVKAGS